MVDVYCIDCQSADNYDEYTLCPNAASWKEKMIMFGACGLYFVKSFFMG